MFENEDTVDFPEKAEVSKRLAAKLIDLALAFIPLIFSLPAALIWGVLYLSFCDGLGAGESAGKRAMKLHVVSPSVGQACDYQQSAIRNLPITLFFALLVFPNLGLKLIALTVGSVALALETYFIVSEPHGLRLGDVISETEVISHRAFASMGAKRKAQP